MGRLRYGVESPAATDRCVKRTLHMIGSAAQVDVGWVSLQGVTHQLVAAGDSTPNPPNLMRKSEHPV